MSDHHYKTIHSCDVGFVTKCLTCSEVQIMAGNVFSWMHLDHFLDLVEDIMNIDISRKQLWVNMGNDTQRIMIKTRCDNLMVSFEKKEFIEFRDMLNMSSLIIQTENLIKTTK